MATNHAQIQMTVKENRDTHGAHLFFFFVHVVIVIDHYKYRQMSRANIKETAEIWLLLGCSSFTGRGSSSMHSHVFHDDDGWPQPTTMTSVARDMMCTCSK